MRERARSAITPAAGTARPSRLCIGLLLGLLATLAQGAPVQRADAAWLGADACGGCHRAQYEAWRGSHHDLAMQPATADTVLGDFDDAHFAADGIEAHFHRRDGRFLVRTAGADGQPAEFTVSHVFGVEPLQQLLIPLPGGRLQAFRVAWDARPAAAGGQRWYNLYAGADIPPGDALHWTGIQQNWNSMCAECHSSAVQKHYSTATRSFATSYTEMDVACEACHGAGARHGALAGAGAFQDPAWPAILALRDANDGQWLREPGQAIASLSAPRSDGRAIDTCARCHSRRVVLSEDARPGEPLLASHRPSLLTAGLYHADGRIDDEVYVWGSFLQSKMYAAGVSCADCHDPHSLSLRAPGAGVCAQCHASEHFDTPAHHRHAAAAGAPDCIDCHMPGKHYMGIDYRHDHGLRVPRPDIAMAIGAPDACTDCHRGQDRQALAASFRRWYPARAAQAHYGEIIAAGRRGGIGAGADLAALAQDAASPAIVRATAIALLADYPQPGLDSLLADALADANALVRMAAVDVLSRAAPGLRERLLPPLLTDPALTVRAGAARALAPLRAGTQAAGVPQDDSFEVALQAWRDAQTVNAERAFAHLNLAALAQAQADPDTAAQYYREALELEPGLPAPWVNLADLLRSDDRNAEALALLEQAATRFPDDALVHHALGLARVRAGDRAAALESLARARERAPAESRYAYVYAVALHGTGATGRAIAVLEQAHEARPVDTAVLRALIDYQQRAGNMAGALQAARTLQKVTPWDRRLDALIGGLEQAGPAR